MADPAAYDDDDDEEEPFDVEYFEDMSLRIRSLSNAIWVTEDHTPKLDSPPEKRSIFRAYSCLATLLTRDSRQHQPVVVTGNHILGRPGNNPLVETDSAVPIPQFMTAFVVVDDRSRWSQSSPSRNAMDIEPQLSQPLHRVIIQPGESGLEYFSETTILTPDITCYAEDLMEIIFTLANSKDSERLLRACRYIFRQCWPDIFTRIFASESVIPFNHYIYSSFVNFLRAWKPQPEDEMCIIGETDGWEAIHRKSLLAKLLQSKDIERDENVFEGQDEYALTLETAGEWFSILCDILEAIIDSALTFDADRNADYELDTLIEGTSVLTEILDCAGIQRILKAPSLASHLISCEGQMDTESFEPDNRSGHKNIDDERRDDELPGEHLLRYLQTLLAWFDSLDTLASIVAERAENEGLPTLRIVYSFQPATRNMDPASARPLLMYSPAMSIRFLLEQEDYDPLTMDEKPRVWSEEQLQDILEAVEKLFPQPGDRYQNFIGGVHSEALLMDYLGETMWRHFDWDNTYGFKESNRIVALPLHHQTCYCCSFLYSFLLCKPVHPMNVRTRRFPGRLIPWTPPPLLHNSDALNALYGHLLDMIETILNSAVRSKTPTMEGFRLGEVNQLLGGILRET
ncbi:uncharacterized protein BT62DRAFT_1074404 [Guyanagaster necrorhizus]|uniref:Uncharacterized protein n=1 Tax=Guyanagaster necrorhizus TaxID=856835 RepID=A0A9P7VYH1_9AGAR|nr:uncharacterized protein BT62DRAFT_1074404 [Guyanagaster necrorhizus MCA 3950]KAG7448887.1 hypothetical protein BT62DRAFT_1074404 [Guyanagaster necrorhizus MCA 3950]